MASRGFLPGVLALVFVGGSATADVEVSSMLERQVVLTSFGPYAAFAAAPVCGAASAATTTNQSVQRGASDQ